ncbi:MAG: hypothetical protein A2X34_05615 [Elusimicrobia bacterium GWC2_51_8]|nr:MAG: hypothetical protein A2X33_09840 [Elusimicrobia bacterium GWA2_51_34]OGR65977.1 MAG: hypothetical protein A2X34_05615 [Elusimicrobia bacterium GWC2_51_8]OGR88500.1 MAG: hypothetical protein A2021_06590 [Elusimicrobia bacterium GWF2_52_66]HAF95888.1 hypothetical protein [Elusimicrobiota bacterium]HCE97999.1 hypothetical protein [Elusimicrobiota bacterium]
MKILLTLVFAIMFYSVGFSQQVQLLGEDSGSGQAAEEKTQVVDLMALEPSPSQKPAVKAVAAGVKGIKKSSSTAKNVKPAVKKKVPAKKAKNTAKIAVSTSAPMGAAGKTQVMDLMALELSPSQEPAVKAVAAGVKGIKESSSTAKNVKPAEKKKVAAKRAKNTAKIAVSTSAPAGAAVESAKAVVVTPPSAVASAPAKAGVSVKSPVVKKTEPEKIAAPLETVEVKPAAEEQKRGFAVNKRHLVVDGETLWDLSQKYYKDPFKWGRIYNANINSVSNPDLIYPRNELEIPDITEEVHPLAKAPAVKEEPVIGEDETMKEPELVSSEILPAPEASVPAKASLADKSPAVEELFKSNDLSEEMPADQKEWSNGVKIVNNNWHEDGVITSKAASDQSMVDSLSINGEIVLVKLRLEGFVKIGDYLEAYLKGTSVYGKKGKKAGFELQRVCNLEVLSVEGKRVRAKVLDASTSISKGMLVKKK